jgi:hypothetical protein
MWSTLKSAFSPVEKRVAKRTAATGTGTVRIDRRNYTLVNWSASGILISGHKDHLIKGQRFRLQIDVDDGEQPVSFSAEAVVVRLKGDKLAAQFHKINKHKKAQIHRYFGRRASAD